MGSRSRSMPALLGGVLLLALGASSTPAAPNPGAAALGLMQGFPPPADKVVKRGNFMTAPNNRWAFQHIRELQPTREIWRGDGPVSALESAPQAH